MLCYTVHFTEHCLSYYPMIRPPPPPPKKKKKKEKETKHFGIEHYNVRYFQILGKKNEEKRYKMLFNLYQANPTLSDPQNDSF